MSSVAYVGAKLLLPHSLRPTPGALRVADGHIVELVADASQLGPAEQTVHLDGCTVLPGLVDAHVHVASLGARTGEVDLAPARSEAEAVELVARAAARLPPGTWVRGRGWDHSRWDGRYPGRATLDALVPAHPVALLRVDSHSLWVNGAALARVGLGRGTRPPPGGAIPLDARGEPAGILVDAAMAPVVAALPPPTSAELREQLYAGLSRFAAGGLTGVHDMGLTPAMLAALDELAADGRLPVRVTGYLYGAEDELLPLLARGQRRTGLVRVPGVKLLLDGALGSHGAAMTAPYADAPTLGLLLHEPAALARWAELAARYGLQLALHAIGDRANAVALDTIAAAQARSCGPGRASPRLRHRVEHAQVVPQALVARFVELGAVASVQPIHAVDDRDMAPRRLGSDRLATAYPLRRFVAAGVPVALGSDAPIASEDPWRGVLAAVARTSPGGPPPPPALATEALSLRETLAAYSAGAALAAGDDGLGRLEVGALADFSVVHGDPFALEPTALAEVHTALVVVEGRHVAGPLGGEPGAG